MSRRRRLRRVAAALSMALLVTACSAHSKAGPPSAAASHSGYCAGTTPGSQVIAYGAQGLDYWYSDVQAYFQAACGVDVEFVPIPSRDIPARLLQEKASPFADVVIADAPDMAVAGAQGLLAADATPGSAGVPDGRCSAGRQWCDVMENFVSFVYNPALIGSPPRTWDDLVSSKYAGRMLLSNLNRADDGRSLLELLVLLFGRDGALRYITRLERSVKSHWISTDWMDREVAKGPTLVANGELREGIDDIVQYFNLRIWFPAQGSTRTTVAVPYGAALVRDGPHRENGVAVLRYVWSVQGQAQVAHASAMPARTDVAPVDCRSRDLRKILAGVRILRPDWAKIAADVRFLAAAWLRLERAPNAMLTPAAAPPFLRHC